MKGRIHITDTAEKHLWAELMSAWQAGDPASHFELAARYTDRYPDNVWGWVALADVLVHLARYRDARRALSRAERLASSELRGHICVQRGHLYLESCDLRRAEKWYRRAVEVQAETSSLVFLGAVLAKQGRFAEAKRCHRRAIRLATDPPDEALCNLGLILRAERRYAEALRCFDQAIGMDPKYRLAIDARKDVLRAMKLR